MTVAKIINFTGGRCPAAHQVLKGVSAPCSRMDGHDGPHRSSDDIPFTTHPAGCACGPCHNERVGERARPPQEVPAGACGVRDGASGRACLRELGHPGVHATGYRLFSDPKPEEPKKARTGKAKSDKPTQRDDGKRCGVMDPKGRHACAQDQGHVGVHSNGPHMWKDAKAKKPPPPEAPKSSPLAAVFGDATLTASGEPTYSNLGASADAMKIAKRDAVFFGADALRKNGIEVPPAPSRKRHIEPAIKTHPVADALPMIEGAEFEALVEDIRANGLRHKPVLDHAGEWLVDGRNRKRACEQIGITFEYEHLPEGTNIAAYVISTNLKRRHLNESQRGMIAAAIANLGQGKRKTRPEGGFEGVTQAEAAVGAGVSERTVQRANAVRDKGVPELVDAVVKGKVDLKGAEQVAKLSPKQQRDLIKERVDTSKGPVRGGKLAALSRQETKRETVRNINTGKVKPMPIGQFGVIYADYPWKYDNSDQHDGSRGHMGYPPMELDAILAHAAEAGRRAGKDCIIALWVTNLYIPHIGRVVDAYGAEYHTMLTWPKPRAGVGSWPRGQTEHVVIASIGKPTHTLNEISTLLPSWNPARPGEHSSKPAELAELLVKHCSGPFLELFGREQRDQWTVWGAESDKFEGAA